MTFVLITDHYYLQCQTVLNIHPSMIQKRLSVAYLQEKKQIYTQT